MLAILNKNFRQYSWRNAEFTVYENDVFSLNVIC